MTTEQSVRYTIDDELWESFTVEEVNKQINRLCATGQFRAPNNGDPFVVRLSQLAIMGSCEAGIAERDQLIKDGHPLVSKPQDVQCFYEFSFDDGNLTITTLMRQRRRGSLNWTTQQREEHDRVVAEKLWDEHIERIWWERDFVCIRCQLPPAEYEEWGEIGRIAADVVVILLQDRTANKVEVQPRTRPKLNLNFLQRRPQTPNDENAREILLTIPRRVYKGTSRQGGNGHAHKRMHYRAEHVRQQPCGPRSAPSYREIVIAGMWINATDIPPTERGTPITRNYRFKAVRATTN
jgi:hypothetical protein